MTTNIGATGEGKDAGSESAYSPTEVGDFRLFTEGQLVLAGDNIRQAFGQKELAELAQSIVGQGLLEPLIVQAGSLKVVAGNRRLMAIRLAIEEGKLPESFTIPCMVRYLTDAQVTATMVIENVQREGLAPTEEAVGYQRLIDLGLSATEVARRVGKSQAHISKRRALLDLPREAQVAVDDGRLTTDLAYSMRRLKRWPQVIVDLLNSSFLSEHSITRAEQECRLQDMVDAESSALESRGVRVVGPEALRDSIRLDQLDLSAEELHKARTEPDYAVMLRGTYNTGNPEVLQVELLTDPAAHKRSGDSSLKLSALKKRDLADTDPKAAARAEHRRKELEQAEREVYHMQQLVAMRPKGSEVIKLIGDLFLADIEEPVARRLCSVLALDPVVVEVPTADGTKVHKSYAGGVREAWSDCDTAVSQSRFMHAFTLCYSLLRYGPMRGVVQGHMKGYELLDPPTLVDPATGEVLA